MKLNELVCPTCGLKCLVDATYTTCASCSTYFTAAQSRSVDNPAPLTPTITWPGIKIDPNIQITPIQPQITPWIVTPNDPGLTGGSITVSTSGVLPDEGTYQVWN